MMTEMEERQCEVVEKSSTQCANHMVNDHEDEDDWVDGDDRGRQTNRFEPVMIELFM